MSRRSWRKSGDHQGEQACHRRTPDREPQPGHPRLGELSSSRGKQADLLTSGPRDLSCVMAVGQTEAPQEVQTIDQRHWVFHGTVAGREEVIQPVWLLAASSVPIQRHTKVKGEANPYDPA